MSHEVDSTLVHPKDRRVHRVTEAHDVPHDRVEDRLDVGRRARDDPQDLGGGGLLFLCLRQTLLEVANARAFVLPRLAGGRQLGFGLSLRGLRIPTHRPLLHRAMVGARLRQGIRRGKSEWPVFDDSGERASVFSIVLHSDNSRRTVSLSNPAPASCRRTIATCFFVRSCGPCPDMVIFRPPRTNWRWLVAFPGSSTNPCSTSHRSNCLRVTSRVIR